MAHAQNRSQTTFDEIVRAWQPRLLRFATRILGNEEDALDCLQETFLRLYQGLDSFRGEASLQTWLYKLTTRVCLDELRRRRRRIKTAPIDDLRLEQGRLADLVEDPAEHLVSETERERLLEVLERLPEPHRSALILRAVHNLSYEDVATQLGCSIGTVRSRLARGRRYFRRLWTQEQRENDWNPPASKGAAMY